jgi:hypothetical protein
MMLGQDWVSAAGIALDFAGFSLLLREWWLAFFNEAAQLRMAESLERQRAMRDLSRGHHPPGTPNPFAPLERMQDETAIRRARETHLRTMASRRKVFMAAAVLIVLGFLLQLAGAIPGCCPFAGIAPSGP